MITKVMTVHVRIAKTREIPFLCIEDWKTTAKNIFERLMKSEMKAIVRIGANDQCSCCWDHNVFLLFAIKFCPVQAEYRIYIREFTSNRSQCHCTKTCSIILVL
jgi:hypothetical protein